MDPNHETPLGSAIMLTPDRAFGRSGYRISGRILRWTAGLALAGLTPLLACGSVPQGTEPVGTTSSPLVISGLFATGVDSTNTPLATGAIDPHYAQTSLDPARLGPSAFVVAPVGGWAAQTAASRWISPATDASGASNAVYTYTTTFSLLGVDPTTATLSGTWACDDKCTLSLNATQVATSPTSNYGSTSTFAVPAGSGFVLGVNTLQIAVTNSGGGPTGLQVVSLTGTVAGCTADTQCASTQYCDTQAGACTNKLGNGSMIPTISGHTPALTGKCSSAAVGTSVCAQGVCSATNDECGLNAGEGTCTSGAQCQTTACSANMKCEPVDGCNVDADCTVATQFCLASTNTCTNKLPNKTAIPNDTGHINPTLNGTCSSAAVGTDVCSSGVCGSNNECGLADGDPGCIVGTGPTLCQSGVCSLLGTCEPMGGCNEDADCPSGQWCNETAHSCNVKLGNLSPIPNDPAHTNPTLNRMCTTDAATLVCQSGLCDTTLNTCVECTAADTSRCSGLDVLCGPTGLCIAANDAGADAGAGEAGADAGGDAGADSGSTPDGGTDAGADAATDAGSAGDAGDAGEDAGAGDAGSGDASADGSAADAGADAESEAGEDAGEGNDATTGPDGSNGGSSGGASSGTSGGNGNELEGGGISCSVSWSGSQQSCGGPLLMLAIALGAAFGRGRRRR
jgi:hypothetical protein